MKLLLLLVCIVVAESATTKLTAKSKVWTDFKDTHKKTYVNATEESYRLGVFAQTHDLVNTHNEKFANGQASFQLGINKFSDIPSSEFVLRNGYKPRKRITRSVAAGATTTTTKPTTTTTKPTTTTTKPTTTTTKPTTTTTKPTTTTTKPTTTTTKPTTTTTRPTTTTTKPTTTTTKPTTTTTTTTKPTTTTTKPTTTTTTTTTTKPTTTTAAPIPTSIDWRTKGAVTAVKDQGQCGSCWTFSSTGAIEGQNFIKSGKLVSLSEQNILDCSSTTYYGNAGCDGGWMGAAFQYVADNKGVDTEASYPYTATQATSCKYNAANLGGTDTGAVYLNTTESALLVAVATIGPISVAIDASQPSFQSYQSGVYYEPLCSSTNLDHGVLVVGYGTDATHGDYWIVKNSWGPNWGESGYIRMARNKNNNCGIAAAPVYPKV